MVHQNGAKHAACSSPCNLCGGEAVSELAHRSRSGKPLRTVICQQCGLVWSDPLPHNPRDFYEDDYRVNYKGTYSPKPKHILRAGQVALSRHRKIEPLLTPSMTILDVGSGGGEFSYLLKTLGHHVKGVEPNKGYAEYSTREYGLDVQIGFIQDHSFHKDSFDLITIWHVLEHTENPGDVLGTLHTLLKPQGTLVIEVPNIEAVCQSPTSTFHEAHIFNFNVVTLEKLAVKMGFTRISHCLSGDGGNITIIARKKPVHSRDLCEVNLAGNSEKIIKIVRNHTPSRHYLSAHPYTRLLRRARQAWLEERGTTGFTGGRSLLDQLYAPVGHSSANPTVQAMRGVAPAHETQD